MDAGDALRVRVGKRVVAEGANAQLPDRSRVRTFVITFPTHQKAPDQIVNHPKDKIDRDVTRAVRSSWHSGTLAFFQFEEIRAISHQISLDCFAR